MKAFIADLHLRHRCSVVNMDALFNVLSSCSTLPPKFALTLLPGNEYERIETFNTMCTILMCIDLQNEDREVV